MPGSRVDVLIVTAMGMEYRAVTRVTSGAQKQKWTEHNDIDPQRLFVGFQTIESRFGGVLRLAVAQAGAKRGEAVADRVATLCPLLRPRVLAMTGVCAGRPGKVALGDVIAASLVWPFDFRTQRRDRAQGAAEYRAETQTEQLDEDRIQLLERYVPARELLDSIDREKPCPLGPQMDWIVLQLADDPDREFANDPVRRERCPNYASAFEQLMRGDEPWLDRQSLTLTTAGHRRASFLRRTCADDELPPAEPMQTRLRIGPIASSNQLIRDVTVWEDLDKINRDILGLEMEAAALAAASRRQRIPNWLVMKGAMDHAHIDKDDRFKEHCAFASASLLIDFVRNHLDLRPGMATSERTGMATVRRALMPTAHRTPVVLGRTTELAALHAAWNGDANSWHRYLSANQPREPLPVRPVVPRVIVFWAWGGIGKTTLAARFHAELAARDDQSGLADYFEWSFYTQGKTLGGGDYGDLFVRAALWHFGDRATADDDTLLAADKAEKLAELIAARRALVILDGLEPLQSAPDASGEGELLDEAVFCLLNKLATGRGSALCIVTTRVAISNLVDFRSTTAPHWQLTNLDVHAGTRVLQALGVMGLDDDLGAAVREVDGHAMTLTLMARYLTSVFPGDPDIGRRDCFAFQEADSLCLGGHARRVLAAYEGILEHDSTAQPLALMRALSLFDRPVTYADMAPLFRAPGATLTRPLAEITAIAWNAVVAQLRGFGLVERPSIATRARSRTDDDPPVTVHPIVRDYFADRLHGELAADVRDAHQLLYEAFAGATVGPSPTLDALQPLYRAVVHGCRAGLHEDAWTRVYLPRIAQFERGYSFNELGAFQADLVTLRYFFDGPSWEIPHPAMSRPTQIDLLYHVAVCLRASLRLQESRKVAHRALALAEEDAAGADTLIVDLARFVSAIDLACGDIPGAVAMAHRAAEIASTIETPSGVLTTLVTKGVALTCGGELQDAADCFEQARRKLPHIPSTRRVELALWHHWRWADWRLAPTERILWSSYLQSDGLLSERDNLAAITAINEVLARGNSVERDTSGAPGRHYVALGQLSRARALFFQLLVGSSGPRDAPSDYFAEPRNLLAEAEDGLRRSGRRDYRPLILLLLAWVNHASGSTELARRNLDDAWQLTERGRMQTFQADIYLTRARLFRELDPLADTERLIEACGYGRRTGELADAQAAAAAWQSPEHAATRHARCNPAVTDP